MAISKAERDAMPEHWFAFPRTRQGPMPDENHARLAWDMIDRTKGVTEEERRVARARVLRRAKELGVDTSGWNRLSAMHFEVDPLSAMAIIVPEVPDHPNKMPFSGVMTKLGQPSDMPVGGSGGKRVVIPHDVAEAAIPSLLGMAVDFMPDLDGHDPQRKIGIITAAEIRGDDLHVEGFLYAADFPEETARIKAMKDKLGFSYETAQNYVESLESEFLVLAACTFTGAAILRKDKAAYQTTSLAAAAEVDGVFDTMTKEEFEAALAQAIAPLSASLEEVKKESAALKTSLTASEETRTKVETHARALEACADGMEAAAVGGHPNNGHVAVVRRMASSMRAEAALGKIPHIYRDHDYAGGSMYAGADQGSKQPDPEVAELKAQVTKLTTDLAAATAAKRGNAEDPQRKTLAPQITALLARAGIEDVSEDTKISVVKLDNALKASGLNMHQRLQLKSGLQHAGILAA